MLYNVDSGLITPILVKCEEFTKLVFQITSKKKEERRGGGEKGEEKEKKGYLVQR